MKSKVGLIHKDKMNIRLLTYPHVIETGSPELQVTAAAHNAESRAQHHIKCRAHLFTGLAWQEEYPETHVILIIHNTLYIAYTHTHTEQHHCTRWLALLLCLWALRAFFISLCSAAVTACLLLFSIPSRWCSKSPSAAGGNAHTL